ncbi:MAG TPA: biotin transporter BioY [Candidatus Choladousia intestinigallinarum]|mgnify:CR=1 FL=1|nr:biotin transporter BioY [Candidatus Choladousia intestinigallinarum]
MNEKTSLTRISFTGLFAALLTVLSQIQIPMPSGVPVTMQTFAVALVGFSLGWKDGLMSVFIYLLLGAAGLPVFAGFQGGIGSLAGPTGGFLWGFLFLAAGCGTPRKKSFFLRSTSRSAGLILCHILGIFQYAAVTGADILQSFLLVSAPYLMKDVLSVTAAFFAAKALKRSLLAAGIKI